MTRTASSTAGVMAFVLASAVFAACGSGPASSNLHHGRSSARPATAASNGTASPVTGATSTSSPPTPGAVSPGASSTAAPPTTAQPSIGKSPSPSPSSTASPVSGAPAGSSQGGGPATGGAASSQAQLITVTASGYGSTVATFDAYQRNSQGGWQQVFGPWQADVGYNGVAAQGQKREGDGRTPSGTFGFSFFFGDQADPGGFQFPFRQATPSDYWDDDPSSANYNQWVDTSEQGAGAAGSNPEPMFDEPSYDYGAVIAYNTDPVVSSPPMGSAIFLHVSTGQPTAGCVSLPESDLMQVLKWLDPSDNPLIQIGVG
jgi:L,D-peptidoglycan transpeptidase YkuD (ErfK/YbiS/YcfS/YnhG family)